ncbi:MAG: hypothetical protein HYT82_00240 [Candidatus Harrisonbacteria bacterium]|nr:hypothetical protein [Candidatus Harrisonbacteria bacterium]
MARDLLNEGSEGKKEKRKSESAGAGSADDSIIDGMRMIDDEIRQLRERVAESKESELQSLAEFQEELSAAEKERNEWVKLLNLALAKRAPTLAESAVLKEERLTAMGKAAEAAKGAGVKNLESVEDELRATAKAIEEYEPLDITHRQPSAVQAEGMALREKERLLTEARRWLKKATIIQSLMEAKTKVESEPL